MRNEQVLAILRGCECVRDGHFLLPSGMHADRFCQCAILLQYPDKAREVVEALADQVRLLEATAVVGPAMGGIIVAYEIARQLGIRGMFTERWDGIMQLRRGFRLGQDDRVLIAEDVVTTGKSTLETIRYIERQGAKVAGLCCLVDQRTPEVNLPMELYSATQLTINTYAKDKCPICQEKIPLTKTP